MIAIVVIISISTMLQNCPFLVVGVIKFQFLSKFDDYNTILSIFTLLCIICLGLIFATCKFVPLNICPVPPLPPPCNHHFIPYF